MSVDAATVHEWIENDQALLVDVRETSEFDKEHIPGAMLLPLSAFDPDLFPSVPGKKVVLHCAVGKRSETAGKMLLANGYSDIIHMTGGMEEWKKSGFETEIPYHPNQLEQLQQPQFLCPAAGRILHDEYMVPLGLDSHSLADALDVPVKSIEDLLAEKISVSAEMSLRLARYFSTAADFWLQLQSDHDMERARHKFGNKIKNDVRPRLAN